MKSLVNIDAGRADGSSDAAMASRASTQLMVSPARIA